jgi:hypothetical protein
MPDDPRSVYDAIIAELGATGQVVPSQMFGVPCLKYAGKAFATFHPDAMVFKLRQPEHGEALALAGAHLFDPSGAGRPMKEWVEVPAAHAAYWPALAREALHYLQSTL